MAFKKRGKSNYSRSSSSAQKNYKNENDNLAKITKAPENPLEPATFESLPASIVEAYQRAGWAEVMPVQAHAIPYLLEGRHMMIQSRTGSGKTGAYLLPLVEKIDLALHKAQALVLVPTRELAVQVEKEAKKLFGDSIHTITLYGGVPYHKQLDSLKRGAQLIIGTPGRILDHLQKGTLNLDDICALIFDEADRMLSIGFYPDMKALQEYVPQDKEILVTLFSATYPRNVLTLAEEFLKEPELLSLSQGQVHIANMQHYCVHCSRMEKDRALIRMLEIENPTSSIIFCNTKATVHYITQVLKGFGYNAEELSSELSQARREFVLARLRKGDTRFLVATDVAARGIDVPLLSHVFLYEPPEDKESYIHRAGRTARAGATGTVISLADTMERLEMQKIAKFYDIEMLPYETPKEEDVANVVSQRVVAILEQQKRGLNGLEKERVQRFMELAQELVRGENEENEENLFIFAMLLDEAYQKVLNPKVEEKRSHTRDRGRNRSSSPRSSKQEERTFSSDDTLDSMRDDFQSEMRAKYGNRGPRGRKPFAGREERGSFGNREERKSFASKEYGNRENSEGRERSDRNAPWRHDGRHEGRRDDRRSERFEARERSFENNSSDKDFSSRDNARADRPRERSFNSERSGERNSRDDRGNREGRGERSFGREKGSFNGRGRDSNRRDKSEDAFSLRRSFTSQAKNYSDNDVFFDSDRNERVNRTFARNGQNRSSFKDFAGGNDFAQNGDRVPFKRNDGRRNEDRGDFAPRKSFLPQRHKQNDENFKVFEDENFMRPVRGRGRFGSQSEESSNAFSRGDDSNFKGKKKSASRDKGKKKFHKKGR